MKEVDSLEEVVDRILGQYRQYPGFHGRLAMHPSLYDAQSEQYHFQDQDDGGVEDYPGFSR